MFLCVYHECVGHTEVMGGVCVMDLGLEMSGL